MQNVRLRNVEPFFSGVQIAENLEFLLDIRGGGANARLSNALSVGRIRRVGVVRSPTYGRSAVRCAARDAALHDAFQQGRWVESARGPGEAGLRECPTQRLKFHLGTKIQP